MPKPDRLLKRTTLLWSICYVAALVFDPHTWVISWRGLLESLLWLVVLSLPAFTRVVPGFLAGLPRRHRRLLAAAVAAVLFGQLAGWDSRRTFPLTSWRMFTARGVLHTLTFFEYVGDTADGTQLTLNPPRLFPPVNHTVMMALANLADETDPPSTERLSDALRAIGRMHNRLNPTVPVRSVSLVRCTVDTGVPANERRVQRQPVLTEPVGEQR